MGPLAPPRFSTTKGLPSCSESSFAVSRPITSVVPPCGKPTMTRTGCVGQDCAKAASGAANRRQSRFLRSILSSPTAGYRQRALAEHEVGAVDADVAQRVADHDQVDRPS